MLDFNAESYELVKYYSYTTTVKYRLYEYEGFSQTGEPKGDDARIKQLFFDLCLKAKALTKLANVSWHHDNKSVFKVRHIKTGKELFIGQFDYNYSIGLACNQYFGHQFDFKTMKWGEYINEGRHNDEY